MGKLGLFIGMSKTNLIKNYLDKRFEDSRLMDDGSPRVFVTTSDGKDALRFGVMDEAVEGKLMVVMNRRDVFAIQHMFGLTYSNSEKALMDYIIDVFGFDKSLETHPITIDL